MALTEKMKNFAVEFDSLLDKYNLDIGVDLLELDDVFDDRFPAMIVFGNPDDEFVTIEEVYEYLTQSEQVHVKLEAEKPSKHLH